MCVCVCVVTDQLLKVFVNLMDEVPQQISLLYEPREDAVKSTFLSTPHYSGHCPNNVPIREISSHTLRVWISVLVMA